jgi:hypothetical protein
MQAIVLQRILNGIATLKTGNCHSLAGEMVVTERYDSTYGWHNSNYYIDNQAARLYDRRQPHRRECGVTQTFTQLNKIDLRPLADAGRGTRHPAPGQMQRRSAARYKWDSLSRLLTLKDPG